MKDWLYVLNGNYLWSRSVLSSWNPIVDLLSIDPNLKFVVNQLYLVRTTEGGQ